MFDDYSTLTGVFVRLYDSEAMALGIIPEFRFVEYCWSSVDIRRYWAAGIGTMSDIMPLSFGREVEYYT